MAENYDLYINITYDLKKDRSTIRTNVRQEQVDDLLSTFIRGQMGQGADRRKANERNVYHINMKLDLSFDTFYVSDDTGNKSLRDGIIMHTIGKWSLESRAG